VGVNRDIGPERAFHPLNARGTARSPPGRSQVGILQIRYQIIGERLKRRPD
jgi:hypothetical protein